MSLKISGVTANCGNDSMGPKAASTLVRLLTENHADVVVINCQEVFQKKQIRELLAACKPPEDYAVLASPLMVTRTKVDVHVIAGNTGIATFVIYKRDKIEKATFDLSESFEVRGKNKNKGGLLNALVLTDTDKQTYQIKTISGHLDSYSDNQRANDWRNLKQKGAFSAQTWDELVERTADLQIAGYDANTRDLWHSDTGRTSMWHQETTLDPRIANMVLAPMGSELYSAENTYNTALEATGIMEDSKRKGYAKAGSLDFVALQNNTQIPIDAHTPGKHYTDAPFNIAQEETKRDHNVLASAAVTLAPVSKFERVRNRIAAELIHAAPTLSAQISAMKDSVLNQHLLLAIHDAYLSPEGGLIEQIQLKGTSHALSIKPWFEEHTLEAFPGAYRASKEHALEQLFVNLEKSFNPKKWLFDKKKYIAPLQEFKIAHQNYIQTLANLHSINSAKPEHIELLHQERFNLIASLEQLRSATKDPKKIGQINRFRSILDRLHSSIMQKEPLAIVPLDVFQEMKKKLHHFKEEKEPPNLQKKSHQKH